MPELSFTPVASKMSLVEHIDDILAVFRSALLGLVEADEESTVLLMIKLRGDLVPEVWLRKWVRD